jgi:hypothetical protein
MHKKVLNVTPSFLLNLMQRCSALDSEMEIIQTFEKIANSNIDILTSEDLDGIEQEADDGRDVPDHLNDLKNALEGAIADEDDDPELA